MAVCVCTCIVKWHEMDKGIFIPYLNHTEQNVYVRENKQFGFFFMDVTMFVCQRSGV